VIESLAAATTFAAVVLAVWLAIAAVRGTFRSRSALIALAVLEIALVIDAIAAVIGLAGGHQPKELVTQLAYLIVSLLIAPAVGVQIAGDNSRWAAGLAAAGSLALAVVVIRAQTTWRSA
jgi:hypothetical protein